MAKDPKGKLANNSVDNSPEARARARRLRNEATVSERRLWDALKGEATGFKFRRQHPVLEYVLDFYCPEAKVCVEVDGPWHALRHDKDEQRDRRLSELGVFTFRIPAQELFDEISSAKTARFAEIVRVCEERSGRKAWQRDRRLKRD